MAPATAFETLSGEARRGCPRWYALTISIAATFLIVYHLYIGVFGPPTNMVQLPVHLFVTLAILFMVSPLGRAWHEPLNLWSIIDGLAVAGCAWCLFYYLSSIDTWHLRWVALRPLDYFTALIVLLLVLESVRRTVGWALIVLSLILAVYALTANRFPGILFGPPVRFESLLQTLVIGDAGVFGVPLLVMVQYIVLFLLFGRFLLVAGAGSFFIRLAMSAFGHRPGGPAKAAVIASGLFGTLNGASVSNVLTTGSFTIPMMKRSGYRPAFAAGVEATASVGGAIVPPVMGAVAFMMAEFLGVPFVQIAIAAAIPAFLYYFAIYWTVHFEARRTGLKGLPRGTLPPAWIVIRREGYLMLPLVLIILMLALGYSIVMVAVFSILGTIVISFGRAATQMSPSRAIEAFDSTARTTTALSAICACAGIIIGTIFATGLTYKLSQAAIGMGHDQLWLLLIIAAGVALVLGTGLTASAVYITLVATIIPVLLAAGVTPMGAHMFAFYYGVASNITPPTAVAAVAVAGIAAANPFSTMMHAFKLGIAAYLVPFLFIYAPAILMDGSWAEILAVSGTACIGLLALSAAITGYWLQPLKVWQRLVLVGATAMFIVPDLWLAAVGIALLGVALLPAFVAIRKEAQAQTAPSAAENTAPTPEPEQTLDLRSLADDEPQQPAKDAWDILAWAAVGLACVVLGYAGRQSLHGTDPISWLGLLLAISTGFVLAVSTRLRFIRPAVRSEGLQ